MKPNPLEELTIHSTPLRSPSGTLLQPGINWEAGQFNVFNVADLMVTYHNRPPMTFDRRAFYKISLVRGLSRVEYADQAFEITQNALWFATHRVPYRWVPHHLEQVGYYCLFTHEFLLPAKGGMVLDGLPVFQPGNCPVWEITHGEYAEIETIFEKMALELTSDYTYKYDLLRALLLELIYSGQKLQPLAAPSPAANASTRLAMLFADLLERQFPLENPQQTLQLRTPSEYADKLAVHVNHLNRVLKDTTGQTTTTLIGSRITQEAKILLRQTSWNISEIAYSLGFADVAHFCNFFKRQTGRAPGDFRL